MTLNEWAYSANRQVLKESCANAIVHEGEAYVFRVYSLTNRQMMALDSLSDYAAECIEKDTVYLMKRGIES